MTNEEFYTKIGGNYKDTLFRLTSDKLIRMFVVKFLKDTSFDALTKAFAAGDTEAAFQASHTLKGVSANLGFTVLFNLASELTESLRGGKTTADMAELYKAVKEEYAKTFAAVQEFKDAQ